MNKPTLGGIYIAPWAGAVMQALPQVRAIAGIGLENDRYALQKGSWKGKGEEKHKPKRNLTLISEFGIIASNRARPNNLHFTWEDTRRNAVIIGLDVNILISRTFQLGSILCRGIEYAEPCDRPSKLCGKPGFEASFHGNGGVNCEILNDGTLSIGDELIVLSQNTLVTA